VFLGARRARNYMQLLAAVLIVLIAAATFFGVFSSVGWWMLPAPLLILAVLRLFFDRITKSELVCPFYAKTRRLVGRVSAPARHCIASDVRVSPCSSV